MSIVATKNIYTHPYFSMKCFFLNSYILFSVPNYCNRMKVGTKCVMILWYYICMCYATMCCGTVWYATKGYEI